MVKLSVQNLKNPSYLLNLSSNLKNPNQKTDFNDIENLTKREEKIARIKESIKKGEYQLNFDKIAEKILNKELF